MQAFCQCHAFTTQSHFFHFISKKISLINIGPSIWFQHRFLISGQSSTTLFSVDDNCQKVDENCTLTVYLDVYSLLLQSFFAQSGLVCYSALHETFVDPYFLSCLDLIVFDDTSMQYHYIPLSPISIKSKQVKNYGSTNLS